MRVHAGESHHRRRPIGVTIIAALQAMNALSIGAALVAAELDPEVEVTTPQYLGVGSAAFVIAGLVTAVGLLLLQRWAWVATMLWAGFVLLSALVAFFRGDPVSYVPMAVTIVQVLYLNLTEVQEAFKKKDWPEVRSG